MISWISFLPFDWESQKKLKLFSWTAVFFLLIMRKRAAQFFKSSSGFPNRTKKEKSKNSYLSAEIRFRISRSIGNPKSGF